MKVVSLAPAATAAIEALDATDRLAATTSHAGGDTDAVGGWLTPDLSTVDDANPDIVFTADALQDDIRDALEARGHDVHHFDPRRLTDVYEAVRDVGNTMGLPSRADILADRMEHRVSAVKAAVPDDDRPTVYCEEWPDPPMAAGNWVPDAVRAAGGRYPFVASGDRSRRADPEAVEQANPDHAIIHYCGHDTTPEPAIIADRDWAVNPTVTVIDDSLLNQPSPRLVKGVEKLAAVLHGYDPPSEPVAVHDGQ